MSTKIKVTTTRSVDTLIFAVKDALLPYGKSIPISQPGAAKLHPVAAVSYTHLTLPTILLV